MEIEKRRLTIQEDMVEDSPKSSLSATLLNPSQVPGRGLYSEESRQERVQFLRDKTSAKLNFADSTPFRSESLKGNIENYVGALTIPIGVAGPLIMNHADGTQEELFAPIATTEGALVASITRGARAISLSGGFRAKVISQRMNRVPMFEFETVFDAVEFAQWIETQFAAIQKYIKKFSNYSELIEIEAKHFGRSVHLRFAYTTRDAAGQNMTTICTWNTCQWLLKQMEAENKFHLREFILDGNVSSDKKASFGSLIQGRGTEVVAEAVIRGEVLKETLKMEVDQLVRMTNLAKSGRLHTGMMGWNINVSNVLAGMFAATGQDIACVHESSVAEFHLEAQTNARGGKDLYIAIHLPCLIVGTVGGGTRLPVQAENLELIGCQGEGKAARLAEVIAGFCLALDISTLCAMIGGQFADAHNRLGRSAVSQWLKKGELDQKFIAQTLHDFEEARILSIQPIANAQFGNSLVMDLSSQVTQKLCGFFPFEMQYRDKDSVEIKTQKILLKVKPKDEEVMMAAEMMAAMNGSALKQAFLKIRGDNLFQKTHVKEIHINALPQIQSLQISPKFYGSQIEESRQIYLLVQEFIGNFAFEPSADDLQSWTPTRIREAIQQISKLHGQMMATAPELLQKDWIGYVPSETTLHRMRDFFAEIAKFGFQEFESWITASESAQHQWIVDSLDQWAQQMEQPYKTLVHNDFNPRNLGFVRNSQGEKFVAFDWELATVALPQRDSVELLSFTLSENATAAEILEYLELHRSDFNRISGQQVSSGDWLQGAICSVREFIIHRLALYFVAHSMRELSFLPRVYKTALHIEKTLKELEPT